MNGAIGYNRVKKKKTNIQKSRLKRSEDVITSAKKTLTSAEGMSPSVPRHYVRRKVHKQSLGFTICQNSNKISHSCFNILNVKNSYPSSRCAKQPVKAAMKRIKILHPRLLHSLQLTLTEITDKSRKHFTKKPNLLTQQPSSEHASIAIHPLSAAPNNSATRCQPPSTSRHARTHKPPNSHTSVRNAWKFLPLAAQWTRVHKWATYKHDIRHDG